MLTNASRLPTNAAFSLRHDELPPASARKSWIHVRIWSSVIPLSASAVSSERGTGIRAGTPCRRARFSSMLVNIHLPSALSLMAG